MRAGDPIRTPVTVQLGHPTGGSVVDGTSSLRITDYRSGLVVLEVELTATQLVDMLASRGQHPQPVATIYDNAAQLGKHVVTASREVASEPGDATHDPNERYRTIFGPRIEHLLADGPAPEDVAQLGYRERFADLDWTEGTASVKGGGGNRIGLLWRTYVECEGEGCPHSSHDYDHLTRETDPGKLRARVAELEAQLAEVAP